MAHKELTVYTWSSYGELPSMSPECVESLALLQFIGTDYVETQCNNPFMSPSHQLPYAVVSGGPDQPTELLENREAINRYIVEKMHSVDSRLLSTVQGDIQAYTALVRQHLTPALDYMWWVDPANTAQMKSIVWGHLPFPLPWLVPNTLFDNHQKRFESEQMPTPDMLYEQACKLYEVLSQRLGGSTYFFGDSPTSFDAALFAHLICARLNLTNNPLLKELEKYPNLLRYATNILHAYFRNKPEPLVVHPAPAHRKQYPRNLEAEQQRTKTAVNVAMGLGFALATFAFFWNRIDEVPGLQKVPVRR